MIALWLSLLVADFEPPQWTVEPRLDEIGSTLFSHALLNDDLMVLQDGTLVSRVNQVDAGSIHTWVDPPGRGRAVGLLNRNLIMFADGSAPIPLNHLFSSERNTAPPERLWPTSEPCELVSVAHDFAMAYCQLEFGGELRFWDTKLELTRQPVPSTSIFDLRCASGDCLALAGRWVYRLSSGNTFIQRRHRDESVRRLETPLTLERLVELDHHRAERVFWLDHAFAVQSSNPLGTTITLRVFNLEGEPQSIHSLPLPDHLASFSDVNFHIPSLLAVTGRDALWLRWNQGQQQFDSWEDEIDLLVPGDRIVASTGSFPYLLTSHGAVFRVTNSYALRLVHHPLVPPAFRFEGVSWEAEHAEAFATRTLATWHTRLEDEISYVQDSVRYDEAQPVRLRVSGYRLAIQFEEHVSLFESWEAGIDQVNIPVAPGDTLLHPWTNNGVMVRTREGQTFIKTTTGTQCSVRLPRGGDLVMAHGGKWLRSALVSTESGYAWLISFCNEDGPIQFERTRILAPLSPSVVQVEMPGGIPLEMVLDDQLETLSP